MTFAISDFVKGLLPGLKKDTVLEDLRISMDTLDKTVIPMMDRITTVLKTKFKNEHLREIEEEFNRAYKGQFKKQPNMLLTIKDNLGNIRSNADFIQERLEELLDSTIVPDGLTSRKAVLIRAAKQISFLTDFTLDSMNMVLILETLAVNGELAEDMELSKGTMIRIQRNVVRYAYAITDLGKGPEKFKKSYEGMRDVYVGGKNARNVQLAGTEVEVDPFESRLVQNVAYNPIYHIRIAVAQWQASRYKAAIEKKKVLELRVLQLKAEMDNKGDPRILNEINYTQSRIDKLEAAIHDAEASVGM